MFELQSSGSFMEIIQSLVVFQVSFIFCCDLEEPYVKYCVSIILKENLIFERTSRFAGTERLATTAKKSIAKATQNNIRLHTTILQRLLIFFSD